MENIFHPLYFSVNLSQLTPGVKNIVITYPGDEKFDSKSFNKTFTVLGKIRSEINYKGITYLKLPSDAKGNLSIYLNNTLYKTSPIINGNANLTFDLMGEYSIEINYTGDDYDVEGISQKKIMISPYLDYQEFIRYMDNNILYMEFPDDASGNVTIIQDYGKAVFNEEIADHKINFSFNNLIFNFEPSELSQSSFITVEYTYQNKTHTENIEVIIRPIPSQILKVKDITMYYGDSKTFMLKLKEHTVKLLVQEKL